MNDTTEDIQKKFEELLSKKTPGERLQMACSMLGAAKDLVESGIYNQYGDIPEDLKRGKILQKFYGDDFTKAELEEIVRAMPNMRL